MPVFDNKITIQRASFDVFKYIGNFANSPKWQTTTTAVSVAAGDPVRVGTMVSLTKRLMGRPVFINADVLDYQLNKLIELKGMYGNFPYRRTMSFSSSGGATEIHDVVEVRTGWLYFWYAPFLSSALGGQLRGEWETLKQLMESRTEK